MLGWCIFFLLLVLVLVYRERKKNARKFDELDSRLSQVEELVLELCALVEERETAGEPSPSAALEEKKEGNAHGRKEEERKEVSQEAAGQTRPYSVPAPETKPVQPVAPPPSLSSPPSSPEAAAQPERGEKKGRKPKVIPEQLPEWHQQIIELWQQGLAIPEIARQTGKGQGEVQLIVDLYCKERP